MFYMVNKPLQLMRDQLADEIAVGLARRERPVARVVVEEFVCVRQVEVAGEEECVREVARLVYKWMAERHVVFTERGVAKMAEEYPLKSCVDRIYKIYRILGG